MESSFADVRGFALKKRFLFYDLNSWWAPLSLMGLTDAAGSKTVIDGEFARRLSEKAFIQASI